LRLKPSGGAWFALAHTLLANDEYASAATAYRHAERLGASADEVVPTFYVLSAIRSGDFARADAALEGAMRARANGDVPSDVFALHAISMRQQGRLRAALSDAKALRASDDESGAGPTVAFDGAAVEALVLFEMGHAREAAARFDSIATRSAPVGAALQARAARHQAWMLTHAATALAAGGDTSRLPALADSIERLGARSFYGRDRLLHHHVRGLLLEARGQLGLAAAEFRRAIFSPTLGYTRSNYELARCLLSLGRPEEAVPVLEAALRGPLDASNMYVTRTELQDLLARVFDAAGEIDSARVYYRRVAAAWRGGDPPFDARARAAAAAANATDLGERDGSLRER
jgi:tetratricopeptide (TPR) repeat protein